MATKNQKLKVGMTVEVSPRTDRTGKNLIQGKIAEILTKTDFHPHGILVKLESGEEGRVKNILDGSVQDKHPEQKSPANNQSLSDLIKQGESYVVEFKDRALWSTTFTNEDIKNHRPQTKELHAYGKVTSKVIVAKILASFLNSNGGTLIIGVKENKDGTEDKIVGVEQEYEKLKDPCQDGYRRMMVDLIKDYFPSNIFNHLDDYFRIDFEEIDSKNVCGITVSKSDKHVFLKLNGIDHFFKRTDASTRELVGEEIVDYCHSKFF